MRMFEISVQNNKVKCKPKTMHVPPHTREEIAVCLDKTLVGQYDLELSLDDDPTNALAKQKLSPSVTVLQDDNRSPSEPKFTISLKSLNGKNDLELDPIIVNE